MSFLKLPKDFRHAGSWQINLDFDSRLTHPRDGLNQEDDIYVPDGQFRNISQSGSNTRAGKPLIRLEPAAPSRRRSTDDAHSPGLGKRARRRTFQNTTKSRRRSVRQEVKRFLQTDATDRRRASSRDRRLETTWK